MNASTYRPAMLPGFTAGRAPVSFWRGSTTADVQFVPLAKKEAVKRYWDAHRFEKQTRARGRQDGALGRNGMAILHAFTFEFLNYATGALFPSYEAIAVAANISVRSVARGIVKLCEAGVIHKVRRLALQLVPGERPTLVQSSNAYAILSPNAWRGFWRPPPAPPPHPSTWGAAPPMPGVLGQIGEAVAAGLRKQMQSILESDPGDALAAQLARLGRKRRPENP